MKARLRKPIDGLEVDTIYDVVIDGGTETIQNHFVVYVKIYTYETVKEYRNMEDLLADWEVLQPVSDTTKQAIEKIFEELILYKPEHFYQRNEGFLESGEGPYRVQSMDSSFTMLDGDEEDCREYCDELNKPGFEAWKQEIATHVAGVVSVLEGKE